MHRLYGARSRAMVCGQWCAGNPLCGNGWRNPGIRTHRSNGVREWCAGNGARIAYLSAPNNIYIYIYIYININK